MTKDSLFPINFWVNITETDTMRIGYYHKFMKMQLHVVIDKRFNVNKEKSTGNIDDLINLWYTPQPYSSHADFTSLAYLWPVMEILRQRQWKNLYPRK